MILDYAKNVKKIIHDTADLNKDSNSFMLVLLLQLNQARGTKEKKNEWRDKTLEQKSNKLQNIDILKLRLQNIFHEKTKGGNYRIPY